MKQLFLDTNILIDLLSKREPFRKWAYKIFKDQKQKKWKLFTSSYSILTTYYILTKNANAKKYKQAIKILLSRIEVISIDKNDLLKGLITNFSDFEDSIQHECALKIRKVDCIVSRNPKDFKSSVIPVLRPEELYFSQKFFEGMAGPNKRLAIFNYL